MKFRCVFKNKQGNFNTFEKDGTVAFPHHNCIIQFNKLFTIMSDFRIEYETERCCFFDGAECVPELPATYKQLSDNTFISKILKNYSFKEIGIYGGLLVLFGDDDNAFVTVNNAEIICGVFTNGKSKYDTSGYYVLKQLKRAKDETNNSEAVEYRKLDISIDEFIENFFAEENISISDVSQYKELKEKRRIKNTRFIFRNKDDKFITFNNFGKVMFAHRDIKIQPVRSLYLIKGFETVESHEKYDFFTGEICQLVKPSLAELCNDEAIRLILKYNNAHNPSLYETDNMYIIATKISNTIITKVDGEIKSYEFLRSGNTYNKCGYFSAFNQEEKVKSKYEISDILILFKILSRNTDLNNSIGSAKLGFCAVADIEILPVNDIKKIMFYNGFIVVDAYYRTEFYVLDTDNATCVNISYNNKFLRYIEENFSEEKLSKEFYESTMQSYFKEGFLSGSCLTSVDGYHYLSKTTSFNGMLCFSLHDYDTIKADKEIYEKELKVIEQNRQHLNQLLTLAVKNGDRNVENYKYFKVTKFPNIKK